MTTSADSPFRIWDTFMYSGEAKLLCARIKILNEYCDYFVITESTFTHSGQKRSASELNFRRTLTREYPGKIRWVLLTEPNPKFTSWQREIWQRRQIAKGLAGINDNDIVMLSDLDEIPNSIFIRKIKQMSNGEVVVAKMNLFFYEYDLKSKRKWYGTTATTWNDNIDFQQLRMCAVEFLKLSPTQIVEDAGIHFSSIGDATNLSRKIRSFAHTEFNTFPFNNRLFLKLLISLGICFDGSEVLEYSPIDCEDLGLQCKRKHRNNRVREKIANWLLPFVRLIFSRRVGTLSSPS